MIRRKYDADGPGSGAATNIFLVGYDGIHPTLAFDGTAQTDVSNRFLWGPQVDQLFADEQVTTPTSEGNVLWLLGDQVGTLRDIADYNGTAYTVTNHRTFDSFGNLTAESQSTVDEIFAYTGKFFDEVTKLSNHLNRWFDPGLGKWVSEDPIGSFGKDLNLFRYVGNFATSAFDAKGLDMAFANGGGTSGPVGESIIETPNEQIIAIGILASAALKHAKTWVPSAENDGRTNQDGGNSQETPVWGINSTKWGPRTAKSTTVLIGGEAQATLGVGITLSGQVGITIKGETLVENLSISELGGILTFGWVFGIPLGTPSAQAGGLATVSNANDISDLNGESGVIWGSVASEGLGVDVSLGNLQEIYPRLPMGINNALESQATTLNLGVGAALPGLSAGTAHTVSATESRPVHKVIVDVVIFGTDLLPRLWW